MLDGQRIEQSITRFRPTDHERWDGQAEARMTGSSSCLFADELPLGSALVSSDGTPTRSARDRDAQNKCRSFRGPGESSYSPRSSAQICEGLLSTVNSSNL